MRNTTFDSVKGFLLILVILGHIWGGQAGMDMHLKFVYFFHMPCFLAISGYFVKKKLLQLSFADIFKKYYNRILVPWLIAFVVFFFMLHGLNYDGFADIAKKVVQSLFYPYFHLWYVPAVFLFVLYCKIAEKFSIRAPLVLIVSFLFTFFYLSLADKINENSFFVHIWGDKRFYYYFYYFYLGYYVSQVKISPRILSVLAISLPFSFLIYSNLSNSFYLNLGQVLANTSIITFLLSICRSINSQEDNLLAQMGNNSLPIYLWHVLPLFVINHVFEEANWLYYSSLAFVFSITIFVIIKFRNKNAVIDRFFYGIT